MAEDQTVLDKIIVANSQHPVRETMEKFLEAADVKAVYGKPIEHGEALVIPAAEVLSGIGFGLGFGGGEAPRNEGKGADSGGGGGGGGGGRVLSRPVAVIIIDAQGVRVEPVIDPTKIALAFFTTLGFMAAAFRGMGRKKLELEK